MKTSPGVAVSLDRVLLACICISSWEERMLDERSNPSYTIEEVGEGAKLTLEGFLFFVFLFFFLVR